MAKCVDNKHKWILMNAGAKTYVMCIPCGARFPFTSEYNGTTYSGPVPDKYRKTT